MGRKPEVEPRPDTRAADALQAASLAAAGQPKAKQVELYLSVRQAYPSTVAGEEALYRAAVLAYDLGEYAVARKQLNELLFENPLFDKAVDARLKLGESSLQLKAYRDAYQTLLPLREKVPAGQRVELEDALRRAAEGARMANQALRLALDRAESATTPEERQAALEQVASLIDTSVPFDEVARMQDELSPSHPAWPMLTFKLARVYAHLRDSRLKPTLEALVQKAPASPYSQQAQAMLARVDRVGSVRGRTLGVLVPLTGKYQRLGEAVMRGIKLALKDSDVELVVKDTQGDPARAAAAVEELVFEDGAAAAIGPLFGEDSRRAAVVAQDLGLPLLTLTRNEDITEIGPFIFRNMLTYSAQGRALAAWAVDVMGYKSFAVLYPNTPYGVEMTSDFWDQVSAKGASVRGAESYANDQTTFTTEAKKLVGRYYLEDRTDYLEALKELKEANKESNADAFRRRKALEKARKDLQPIVDFEALFIPDEWSRVGLIAPALAVEDIITNTCDAKENREAEEDDGQDGHPDRHSPRRPGLEFAQECRRRAEAHRAGRQIRPLQRLRGRLLRREQPRRDAALRPCLHRGLPRGDAAPARRRRLRLGAHASPGAGGAAAAAHPRRSARRADAGEGLRRCHRPDHLQRAARSGKAPFLPHRGPQGSPRTPAPGAPPWLVNERR